MSNTTWTQQGFFPHLYVCIHITIIIKVKREQERIYMKAEGRLAGRGRGAEEVGSQIREWGI